MDRPDTIIRLKDLFAYVGLRRTQVEAMVAAGTFPAPVRLGPRSKGWLGSEVARWQAERRAERDGTNTDTNTD